MLGFRLCHRRYAWAAAALAFLLAAALLPAAPAKAGRGDCRDHSRLPAKTSIAKLRQAVTCLINRRRTAHGLRQLRVSPQLQRAARGHSRSMVRNDFFSHYGRGGRSFIDRIRHSGYLAGANSWTLGEVIAAGSGRWATARNIISAWMHSPAHRVEVLSGHFHDFGVGVARGVPGAGRRGATYTVDFGARDG